MKGVRNLLRMKKKKKIDDTAIKNIKNLFQLRKEIDNTAVKDIRNLSDWKKKRSNEK